MNKRRLYFGLLIFALVLIICWASVQMIGSNLDEETISISVIVSDSSNDRYIALREGLEQAAADNNVLLNFVSTASIVSLDEEMTIIERELENGADGIIVQPVSSAVAAEVTESLSTKTALMLLETDVEPEGVCALTAPDNIAIGEDLAKEVLLDYGTGILGKRIGVLGGNQNQLCMQQRLQGLLDIFDKEGATPVWTISSTDDSLAEKLAKRQATDPIDILITLGNDETETAVDYAISQAEAGNSFNIYGAGCSEKAVYYLDKGTIEVLVVPNEFNMGYLSIQSLAKQLNFHETTAQSVTVDTLVIDKNNLYDEDNQKILFPIVQ